MCELVCPSRTSEREGEGYCVKGEWREGDECEGACEEKCEPNPKPRAKPDPTSADVAKRGVTSIGVRSSGNLCVEEEYV